MISEKLSIYLPAASSSTALVVHGWNCILPAGITMIGTAPDDSL